MCGGAAAARAWAVVCPGCPLDTRPLSCTHGLLPWLFAGKPHCWDGHGHVPSWDAADRKVGMVSWWSVAQSLQMGSQPGSRVQAPWLMPCPGDAGERVTNTVCSAARDSACFGIWALCTIFRERNKAVLPTEALHRAAMLSCAVRLVMVVTTLFQRPLYQGLRSDKGAELQGTEVNSGWHSCWEAAKSQILLYCFSLCVTCDPLGFHQ